MNNLSKLSISIFICQLAGFIGTFFTFSSIENWYNFLNQPVFRPPNWVFGPVWITLYTLMGISFYLIWMQKSKKPEVKNALRLFLIHLFFNASWSIIFFGAQQIFLGLINIVIIWSFIVVLILKFYKLNKLASFLLIPYLAWVSFATILNYNLWILNR